MEILHRAEEVCPGHGSFLDRMLQSGVLSTVLHVCVCLLGREHSLGRPIPNLISSQAVRSLRVNGDTWMQDPLGDFRMACQPRWGCPGLSPNWFHPATVGVGERFLSLVEKVLPKNSSILE